ncbi:MAG TPA: hypothetical protein VNP72_03895 [Longimicrobium sp.]|nr:hypothetical protein [Longimicrobium sp.]
MICEDAATRHDGRLDVHGVFHELFASGFPAQQDQMVLAVAITWQDGERGKIDFSINMLDPSRSPVLTITAQTEVGEQHAVLGAPRTQLIMPLQDVIFPTPGTYEFELTLGGHTIPLTPLRLVQTDDAAES